jgi:hypothetical protein
MRMTLASHPEFRFAQKISQGGRYIRIPKFSGDNFYRHLAVLQPSFDNAGRTSVPDRAIANNDFNSVG